MNIQPYSISLRGDLIGYLLGSYNLFFSNGVTDNADPKSEVVGSIDQASNNTDNTKEV